MLYEVITISAVEPFMDDYGWAFSDRRPDHLHGSERLYEVYARAKPDYTGRVSVPVLWDKKRNTIVSNESAEIIRMFNSAFDEIGATGPDYYPEPLFRAEQQSLPQAGVAIGAGRTAMAGRIPEEADGLVP